MDLITCACCGVHCCIVQSLDGAWSLAVFGIGLCSVEVFGVEEFVGVEMFDAEFVGVEVFCVELFVVMFVDVELFLMNLNTTVTGRKK